jgi:hypothetical protein
VLAQGGGVGIGRAWAGGGSALRRSAGTAGWGEAGYGGCLAFASARGGDLCRSAEAAPARGLSVLYTAQEERIRGICSSITESSSSSDRGFGSRVEIVLRQISFREPALHSLLRRVSFRDLTFLYVGGS